MIIVIIIIIITERGVAFCDRASTRPPPPDRGAVANASETGPQWTDRHRQTNCHFRSTGIGNFQMMSQAMRVDGPVGCDKALMRCLEVLTCRSTEHLYNEI